MSWDPIHDSRHTFRALLAAQCDPGQRIALPREAGDGWVAVMATLLDETTRTAVLGTVPDHHPADLDVPIVDPADAEFVLAHDDPGDALDRVGNGTALNPETGATVLLAPGPSSTWLLTGPGLPEPVRRTLPISAGTMAARNRACADYPRGIDLLVAGPDAIWALPRSTRAEEVH